MPDTRRITGPEETQSPYLLSTEPKPLRTEPIKQRERLDRRNLRSYRQIFLRTGLISQAKGSAYSEFGNTKVVCAVYGPREVSRREDFRMLGQLSCDLKFAPFSCHVRHQHMQDSEGKDHSSQLLEALEPAVRLDSFPKSEVDVYVTVLEHDGSVLAAAITCASLALADAGIEMYDMVVGCSARIHGCTILMDPTLDEEKMPSVAGQKPGGLLTMGFMPSLRQVSAFCFQGDTDLEILSEAMQACQDLSHKLNGVVHQTVVRAVEDNKEKT